MKTTLIAIVIVLGCNFVVFSQAVDPLTEGNKFFEARNYQAAADVYRRIVRTNLDVPTKAKAWFNLGITYQKLGRYDDAINAFTQIFSMNVNDREPGGHIMEPYRNYRSRAQWEVGRSLFAKGDYKGALEAFQTTRLKYPLESWCNVERNSAQNRYALYEGLTYEHLGLYNEAVSAYLRTYVPRIAELYEAAGQLDDLKRFLDKKDEGAFNSAGELARKKFSREQMQKYFPTQRLHGMLKIYALADARDWPALFQLLRPSAGAGGGNQDLIVRLLGKYPKETVPLLKEEVARAAKNPELVNTEIYPELMYKALGFAATPDAIATLKSVAEKEESIMTFELVYALSLAGEPGEKALAELDKVAKHNLRIAIDQYRSGILQERHNPEPIKFPPIPANLSLPKEL